jgi:hypothetical protein
MLEMGSITINNDTLKISREQGFPEELNLEKHLRTAYSRSDFEGRVFEFRGKDGVRNYQQPPIRNFLVENRDGKWIYWGLIHIIEVSHDYENKTTSGKFKIVHINTAEEMKMAFNVVDRNPKTKYFD